MAFSDEDIQKYAPRRTSTGDWLHHNQPRPLGKGSARVKHDDRATLQIMRELADRRRRQAAARKLRDKAGR